MNKKTVQDVDVLGKKCFVRVDFNVPLDENKKITDENRIVGALPTIKYLKEKGAKIILCSHLGRPKSKADTQFTIKPVVARLKEHLDKVKVTLAPDSIGPEVEALISKLKMARLCTLKTSAFTKKKQTTKPALQKSWQVFVTIM